ncbi:TetR/AcrR family transcriptional regulator [Acidaminobacter sp. JC074]|uniref:TetR/AcrR family transcriptional regulator n=1 Tax=Acidaminobacter sp. JC074 TaxID=2530199 RepID=UPI001F117754|nr:TetR/AcrR family transcriptional regulator [Acidaminobacter sp. JC074]
MCFILKTDQSGLWKGCDFIDIKNKKVIAVVNAGLEEFSKYGFEKASLNNILKTAGISKGGFYHHFKDKQDLLDYLLDYISELNIVLMEETIDFDNPDILYRVCEITKSKLAYQLDHPYMVSFTENFIDVLFTDEKKAELDEWRKKIYTHNIDESLFKEGISLKEILQISRWTFKGLFIDLKKAKNSVLDAEDIHALFKACDAYYIKLKLVLYK